MLIDTNVWSELLRRDPLPAVLDLFAGQHNNVVVSSIVMAEMEYGIAKLPQSRRQAELRAFVDDIILKFSEQTAVFDLSAAAAFGVLRARLKGRGELIGERDMLIAAHAIALGVPLVTRDISDMARTGATIINPWEP